MVALIHTKPSNATTARDLGMSRQTVQLYVSVAPVQEVDAAILVASRVI